MKDKKGITVTNAVQKILEGSNRKQNKIWVAKGKESYNSSIKSWLAKNYIEMYSRHYERKYVVAERFIRTLKNEIYEVYDFNLKNTDKLDDIVNKCNNTHHSRIKMKPVDVKSSAYIDSSKEINNKNPAFKIDDIIRISKYKSIFPKGYLKLVWKRFLWLKKSKTLFHDHITLVILKEQ